MTGPMLIIDFPLGWGALARRYALFRWAGLLAAVFSCLLTGWVDSFLCLDCLLMKYSVPPPLLQAHSDHLHRISIAFWSSRVHPVWDGSTESPNNRTGCTF
jgi:hypothetical protein